MSGVCHKMKPQSSPQNAKTLGTQIQGKSWFQQLTHATRMRDHMQSLFDQSLPEDLIGKCQVLEIKAAALWIGTDNAAWATRFRYATPEILPALQQHKVFSDIQTINCMVMPAATGKATQKREVDPIPESAAKSMRIIANTIADPDLKAALLKLASNARE